MQKLLEVCMGEAKQVREQQRHYITTKGYQVRERERERERECGPIVSERIFNDMTFVLTFNSLPLYLLRDCSA